MYPTFLPAVHIILAVIIAIWVIFEIRQALHRRPEAAASDRGSQYVIRLSYVVGLGGALALRRFVPSLTINAVDVSQWIGLALLACGIGLRLWSIQTLGHYFTYSVQTSHDQPVIDRGPYRVIRHPSYAGFLLALLGLGVLFGNWASVVVLPAGFAFGIMYRIRVEERALSRDLDGRYQAYAASHKRLIPFVW